MSNVLVINSTMSFTPQIYNLKMRLSRDDVIFLPLHIHSVPQCAANDHKGQHQKHDGNSGRDS